MQLETKYFGLVDYEPKDILEFSDGLFAFEQETRYLLLPFEGSQGAMLCLQSAQTPALAFVVMDPFSLKPDYAPALCPEELRHMGVSDSHDLCFYTLCAVKNPVSNSTVNLRCPVVINGDTHRAMQVILETEDYHMRHPLSEFSGQKGAAVPC